MGIPLWRQVDILLIYHSSIISQTEVKEGIQISIKNIFIYSLHFHIPHRSVYKDIPTVMNTIIYYSVQEFGLIQWKIKLHLFALKIDIQKAIIKCIVLILISGGRFQKVIPKNHL